MDVSNYGGSLTRVRLKRPVMKAGERETSPLY